MPGLPAAEAGSTARKWATSSVGPAVAQTRTNVGTAAGVGNQYRVRLPTPSRAKALTTKTYTRARVQRGMAAADAHTRRAIITIDRRMTTQLCVQAVAVQAARCAQAATRQLRHCDTSWMLTRLCKQHTTEGRAHMGFRRRLRTRNAKRIGSKYKVRCSIWNGPCECSWIAWASWRVR